MPFDNVEESASDSGRDESCRTSLSGLTYIRKSASQLVHTELEATESPSLAPSCRLTQVPSSATVTKPML